jgi:hypothetical protein
MGDQNQTATDKTALDEWLTVPEAAEYLSNCGSEIFNENRIYKEAIAYRLRLSLYFHDGHPAKMFQIKRTEYNRDNNLEVHSDHPQQYDFEEIVAIYDGCAHPLHGTYKGITTQLYGVYDLTLLGCGKSLITELRFGFDHTASPDPHGIILERRNSFYQVLERLNRPIEYTPAFTFPKGSYLVVRDQSLHEFEKKFLAKKSEANASEQSAAEGLNMPLPPPVSEGRPKGPLHEAVEKLYLKLLTENNFHPLEKGNPSVFIEEMRKHVVEKPISGGKPVSDISAFIQERISDIKGAMGNRRITTQERVLNSSKSKEIIEKSTPFATEDVSKILYSLRKKYPIPT